MRLPATKAAAFTMLKKLSVVLCEVWPCSRALIRGLKSEGVTQPRRSAPIISMVIDGAIQNGEAVRRGARGIWDVEQIEVMRGPQSTLQGRNALAGSVIVNTRNPIWTAEVIVDGMFGGNDMRSGAFVLSGPVVLNQLAVRIAALIRARVFAPLRMTGTVRGRRSDRPRRPREQARDGTHGPCRQEPRGFPQDQCKPRRDLCELRHHG